MEEMRNLFSSSKLYLKQNASTILTVVGAVGVVATTVMAIKATPKALKALEVAEEEKGEELTVTEKVIVAGPVYIPTVLVGASTVACIFSANILNKRTQAALTSAYALLDSSYKEYKNKVTEMLGEDANEQIQTEIAKDKYETKEVVVKEDEQLFYDSFSGRYFTSTLFKVQQAEYYLNRDLTMRDYAYLNEFYEYLDIDEIDSGWKLGWSTGACLAAYWQPWIDFNHKRVTMDDGLECIIITIFQEPFADFENYA
jgi:hypothetical protein